MLTNHWISFILTFVIALLWLRINDYLAHKGIVSSRLSRKIIHIGTGPIFVLCWLLFPNTVPSRFLAAVVPFAITVQFLLIGLGIIKDQASVDAMSRHGDRKEILKGPLFYGIVFVVITILFWVQTPTGIVALMLLCGGDGLADLVGNRVSSRNLPWSSKKTIAGTLAMLVGGWLFSLMLVYVFIISGIITYSFASIVTPITIIAIISTFIETLPMKDIDNITVPGIAVLLGILFF